MNNVSRKDWLVRRLGGPPYHASSSPGGGERVSILDYSSLRSHYKPSRTRLLFIAESPPSSGGYFYFHHTIGKDHLFRETMKALQLWPIRKPMRKGFDKSELLAWFCSMGFFLIDTCEVPVDRLSDGQRKAKIEAGAASIPARLQTLNPDWIVIVKKTVFGPVKDALEAAGLHKIVLNKTPLPFPSHGYQKEYRTRLRRLIEKQQDTISV